MEDSLSTLMQFVTEHQRRECELRRLQNCAANENPSGYVGMVDTQWSDLSEPDDEVSYRTPHFGTMPVSATAPSNWLPGNNNPFALLPEHDPVLTHKTEIVAPWITLKSTHPSGVLFMMPDGDRAFVDWGQQCVSEDGCIHFCAFRTEEEAHNWASSKALALTKT